MEPAKQDQRRSARIREKTEKSTKATKRPAKPKKQKQKQKQQKAKAKPTGPGRKRRREVEAEAEPEIRAEPKPSKRKKLSKEESRSPSLSPDHGNNSSIESVVRNLRRSEEACILHWIQNKTWPSDFFKTDPKRRPDDLISSRDDTATELSENAKRLEEDLAAYLESRGSFLTDHENGITKKDMTMCAKLLKRKCEIPQGTMFEDDGSFKYVRRILPVRNRIAVERVIGRLVVPWAEIEIVRGQVGFVYLVDGIQEPWNSSLSLDEAIPGQRLDPILAWENRIPTPHPDYAVGFLKAAFTKEQVNRLEPFLDRRNSPCPFKGTMDMLFPFLTVEVTCNKLSLGLADLQNAHSMTRALRGVVDLFRLVNREKELSRKILGFSISHDHDHVRIYGHYPVIDMERTTYHRYSVREFSITARNGKERWTSYKFVMALYNDWVPVHFQRLASAIDDLPEGVNFEEVSLKSLDDLRSPIGSSNSE